MLSAYLDGELHRRRARRGRGAAGRVVAEWRAELAEVRAAREAVRGLPNREAPAGFWDAVLTHRGRRRTTPRRSDDATSPTGRADRRSQYTSRAGAGPRGSRWPPRHRGRGRRDRRGAAPQRGDARTSPRWSRSTARRGPTPATPSACWRRSARSPGSADDAGSSIRRSLRCSARRARARCRARRGAVGHRVVRRRTTADARAARRASSNEHRDAADRYDFAGAAIIRGRPVPGTQSRAGAGARRGRRGRDRRRRRRHGRRRRPPHVPARNAWAGPALVRRARRPCDLPAPDPALGRSPPAAPARWPGARPRSWSRPAPDGTPAQRLASTTHTGLLLAREVLGPDGRVERSVRFTTHRRRRAPRRDRPPRRASTAGTAEKLTVGARRLPRAGVGRQATSWSTRSRHPDGVLLFYSDGLFTASVFEQQGRPRLGLRCRAAARRASSPTHAARTYREPSGDVLVWERDGVVYTCVSDAPSDVVREHGRRARRRRPEHRAVDRRLRARPVRLELIARRDEPASPAGVVTPGLADAGSGSGTRVS